MSMRYDHVTEEDDVTEVWLVSVRLDGVTGNMVSERFGWCH